MRLSALLLTLLCSLVLRSGAVAVDTPFNYMPNPSLAGSRGMITQWDNHIAAGECQFSQSKGSGPDGANTAVIVGLDKSSVGRWFFDAPLMPRATYRFSFMLRTSAETSGGLVTSLTEPLIVASPGKWSEYSFTIKVPADVVSLRFHLQAYGKGSVEYSKLSLVLVEMPPAADTATAPVPAAGGEIVSIITSESPTPVDIGCSLEVRRIFHALTGKTISISTKAVPGRCLYIGTAPKGKDFSKRLAKLSEDGIILDINKGEIVCLGATLSGTYNAVSELFYRIGCMWIWPGQYGECLPEKGPISLPKYLKLTYNPPFLLRGGTMCQVEVLNGSLRHVNVTEWTDWAAKNHYNRAKSCYTTTWNYGAERAYGWQEVSGHTTTEFLLPSTEFDKHPEWFALFKGKRVGNHPIGTTAMPCISNKEVQQRFIDIVMDYFENNPDAKRYFVGANDEPSYWCECEKCRALDPPGTDMSKNGVSGDLEMTDRWLYLVNLVAAEVGKKYPGKWVGTYAYASTASLPKKVKPLPNVMIEFTLWDRCFKHGFMDKKCPVNQRAVAMIRAWKKISSAMSIYGYLDHNYPGIPAPYWMSDKGLYNDLYKLGIRYVSDEVNTVPSASPLLMGYRTRLLWDLSEDPVKYLDSFCKAAYGNAAEDMKSFWILHWEAVKNSPTPHSSMNDLARYNQAMLDESYKLLDSAFAKANSDDIRARIARAKMTVDNIKICMIKDRMNREKSNNWAEFMEVRSSIIETSNKWQLPIDYFNEQQLGSGYVMPNEALNGKELVALPERWSFRVDPDSIGENEKWYRTDYDLGEFRPISLTNVWEEQGYPDYDGYGWYFTDVVIPETKDRTVWLLLGAVDDSWTLWIDGAYIAKSTADPGTAWDKPVAADITGKYTPGKKVRIAIRVGDIAGAGGIWKPAQIMTSN